MEVDLKDKIAVITGSSRGIGKATAKLMVECGGTVVISDILEEQGRATAEELGPQAIFVPCDISDNDQVVALVASAVERYGKLDIMVNNAGTNAGGDDRVTSDKFSVATWRRLVDIDLNGAFYGCRAAANQMVKQGFGSIVNVASVAGVVALRLQVPFVAAKAAVIRMTEVMATELGPLGIRVNCISPGSTMVEVNRAALVNPDGTYGELASKIASFIPQGRCGEPEEMANAIVFMASDAGSYINGHNIVVDGGWTCGFTRDFV